MNKEKKDREIELHHESIEEILGTPPVGMVRVGSGMLLVVMLGLLIGSRFITYPDMVKVPALLYGDLPLSIETSPETGKVRHVFQYDNGQIEPGDSLFSVEKYSGEIITVVSRFSGFVEFNPLLEIKHNVQKNDTVAIIWGKKAESVACIVSLSPNRAGNVREGNKIVIHLEKYPSEQYGVIESHVKKISRFNTEKDIQVMAELSGEIKTSYQKEIFIRGNNYATVEIITGEKTLFNRLVNPFRGLVEK